MAATSASPAGRSSSPIVARRSWPLGTSVITLTAGRARSSRSRYAAGVDQSIGTCPSKP